MQMGKYIKWALFGVILLIVVMVVLNMTQTNPRDTIHQPKDDNPSQTKPDALDNHQINPNGPTPPAQPSLSNTKFITGIENLPRSLRDTQVDGDIIIDGNSNLVPTRGLRRLFDYFLSSLGEESAETINARIEAYIKHRTPEPAASQAIALYYQYTSYLKKLNDIQSQYGTLQMQATKDGNLDLNSVKQRQYDIDKLRGELFSTEEISAFFDTDDQLQAYNIAMIEIERNEILTKEQREQARSDYVDRLPDSLIKERVVQKEAMQTLMERTDNMMKRGATDNELFAMRAELVGTPAALRLADVDKENRYFDARFEQYQKDKAGIIASKESDEIKKDRIIQLEQQLFNATEQKRLTGYEILKSQQDN